MTSPQEWLSDFFQGLKLVWNRGAAVTQRQTLNFLSPLKATDNAIAGTTEISIVGGSSNATAIQGVDVDPTTPTNGQFFQLVGGVWLPVTLTQDMIAAGLTVSLSGGSGGVFECGATWTLSGVTASPACNAAGVTAATLTEIINSVAGTSVNVLAQGNPLTGAHLPHTSYTRTGSGDVVDLQLTMTKSGVTKSSALGQVRGTSLDRYFVGQSTAGDNTEANASGNNATLAGGSAGGTLTGTLAALNVGASFTIPASGTPKYTYVWALHTTNPATWADSNNTAFAMSRVTSASDFANQFAVHHNFDLYVTDFALTQAYTVHRAT